MFSRTFAIMLSGVLLSVSLGLQSARAQTGRDAGADEARAKVQKMGVGRDARVEVRLRDNTKVKGYVSAAERDSFTVTDSKTGATRAVTYAEVTHVKKPGGGLSTRGWVIIGAAAVAAVIVGVTVIEPVLCDGGAGC
jgi:hypothetical protein